MPFERTRDHQIKFTLSTEEYGRAKHHSRRLGWPLTEIVTRALHTELNRLDEQQMFAAQVRATGRRPGTKIGALPVVGADDAPSEDKHPALLSLPSLPSGIRPHTVAPEEKPSQVLEESIPRWVNFIASATGAIDRAVRTQQVRDSMKERGATDGQQRLLMEKVSTMLAARESMTLSRIGTAPEGVPITGDVD